MVGIANTTTIRAAGRTLKNTGITAATSAEEAVAMLRTGKADAFALSRDSLRPFVAQLPGSRIVDGGFQQTGIAIAVPKNRAERAGLCQRISGAGQGLRQRPPRARPGGIP